VLAAAAGARRVHAVAADTRFHRAAEVERETLALAARLGVEGALRVERDKRSALVEADVVTNTGPVRPIDAATVAQLKPTAVVALMWETWELAGDMVDLDACRAHGVLVLGTNEHASPCDLRPYAGLTALRLLFELGLEAWGTRVLLLGRQPTLGACMEDALRRAGCVVTTFSRPGEGGRPYADLEAHLATDGAGYDALIVADHLTTEPLVPETLAVHAPAIRVGVVSGVLDARALRAAGLLVVPARIAPPRTMSYSLAELGPRPVLELYAASLKVGEVAARARLEGLDVREAARRALAEAPAMDFPGEAAWA